MPGEMEPTVFTSRDSGMRPRSVLTQEVDAGGQCSEGGMDELQISQAGKFGVQQGGPSLTTGNSSQHRKPPALD